MKNLKLFEEFIGEMSLSDDTTQRILKHMADAEKRGDMEELKRCNHILTGKEDISKKDLDRWIQEEYDYDEIKKVEEEIFGKENKN